MISVTVTKLTDKCYFQINGHANYNPGNDIVCASVSILAYTLAGRLAELGESIDKKCIGTGSAFIVFRINNDTRAVLDTVMCGLRLLEEKYPMCVRVDEE